MSNAFEVAYGFTSVFEGGIADDPFDPGGLTNTGLTLPDLRRFAKEATGDDLRALTDPEKQAIYLALYWLPVAGWDLPMAIALMVFDHAVNCGVGTSAQILQKLLLVKPDGWIGKKTLAAMAKVPAEKLPRLVLFLSAVQDDDYRSKANAPRYIRGWENRLAARTKLAQTLLPATPTGAAA